MKKIFVSILLILVVAITPLIFVGCNKSNSNNSITVEADKNENNNSEVKDPVIELSRNFKFEVYNKSENVNFDFDNDLITVKLNDDKSKNSIHFSVSVLFNGELDKNQTIYHTITNESDIELVSVTVNNYYLKFNKTGTYDLKLVDYSAMLTKTIKIVVE